MIRTSHLRKVYTGGLEALRGIELSVPRGSVFALLGPNGAGKSTLLKVIATLSQPASGTVKVAGYDAIRSGEQVRRQIGYVPQKVSLDEQATARQILKHQGLLYRLSRQATQLRIEQLITAFDLAAIVDNRASTYSGGYARRTQLALTLLHTPAVLILDEPTTGLDPEIRLQLWTALRALVTDSATTVLFSTHYLEEAEQFADQVAIIDQGSLVAQGTPAALKQDIQGDSIVVELATALDAQTFSTAVPAEAGMLSTQAVGHELRVSVKDGAAAVAPIVLTLERMGAAIRKTTLAGPSLEDVYLQKTGRRFKPDMPGDTKPSPK